MKAVKNSEFEEFGCVKCGCEYCYCDYFAGSEMKVICGECHEEFLVVHDSIKISSIGFDAESFDGFIISSKEQLDTPNIDFLSTIDFSNKEIQDKLSKGIGLNQKGWIHLITTPHPRKGIKKHPLVVPDIRPENGIGEYCYPREVGYDIACFVKSKEAGERITEMINQVCREENKDSFHCRLDYRIDEPLWIQVKIQYNDRDRAHYLIDSISNNDNIITKEIVKDAIHIDKKELSKKHQKIKKK